MTNQKLGWKTDRETLPELVPEASPTGDSRAILVHVWHERQRVALNKGNKTMGRREDQTIVELVPQSSDVSDEWRRPFSP